MAYWFARRFAQSPAMIGQALAASFVLAAVGSVLSGKLSVRFGPVHSVLWMRVIGLALLLATPFSPVFGVAAALYASRAAFNQGTTGARQVVAAGLTRAQRRGLAASVQNLSLQIPRAAGPVLGGLLIHAGYFITPFLLAAALQALYLVLYGTISVRSTPALNRPTREHAGRIPPSRLTVVWFSPVARVRSLISPRAFVVQAFQTGACAVRN